MGILDKLDMSNRIDKGEYERRLAEGQRRLFQLRLHIGGLMGGSGLGPGLLVLMEGPDASGKGGAIKATVGHLDPRHFKVVSYAKPTPQEKNHHFLWRFYRELPGLGEMAVFDRSWYGRVLVERVEGFATKTEWKRAYEAIVDFEESLCLESIILVKFWMHVSDEEQLRRFEGRAADPLKRWKLTDEDWRNRDKNRTYEEAAEEMFERTAHPLAPWDVIGGEQKRYARVAVLETVIKRVEEGMARWGMDVPQHVDELDAVQ
ncbi:MAG: UDP-galactose-lipid carrier transferase [Actinomycetota bacterium]|nr:UDP-galactose-lipid carrier transferase [Actinomycetota bacterium]